MIHTEIQKIVGFLLPSAPRLFLLNDFGMLILFNRTYISYLLVSERMVFTKSWKVPEAPSKEEGLQKIRYVLLMDKLSAIN